MINLFLALVLEGYNETLKENEAVISPDQMNELLEKWSLYESHGTG